jgi:hypothetical protein
MTRTRRTACPGSGGGAGGGDLQRGPPRQNGRDRSNTRPSTRQIRTKFDIFPPILFLRFPRPPPPLSTPIPIPLPSRYSTKTVRAPGTTSSFTFSQTHSRSDSPSYPVILSTDFLHCHAPFRVRISRMSETDILNTTYLRANSHWRSDDPSPSTTHIWTTHTSNFP